MSIEKDWLTMLEKATNYSELQSAFARMNVDSQSTDDGDAMVLRIAKLREDRLALSKILVAKMTELHSLPERREKLEQTVKTQKRDYDAAEQRRMPGSH